MAPVGETSSARPSLERTPSVVFVVDTTNAKPGSSNQVWIKRVALRRAGGATSAAAGK
jgi:hypothetical protein